MKPITRIVSILILLALGFAAGFPIGSRSGFVRGSEWAIVQADLIAREAGLLMPVNLADGEFRITFKQPRGLYKFARQLAEKHYNEFQKKYVNRTQPVDGTEADRHQ